MSSSSSIPKADEADTIEMKESRNVIQSRQENTKVADMEVNDVLHEGKVQPIFNKDIIPIIVGEINMFTQLKYNTK